MIPIDPKCSANWSGLADSGSPVTKMVSCITCTSESPPPPSLPPASMASVSHQHQVANHNIVGIKWLQHCPPLWCWSRHQFLRMKKCILTSQSGKKNHFESSLSQLDHTIVWLTELQPGALYACTQATPKPHYTKGILCIHMKYRWWWWALKEWWDSFNNMPF